MNILVIDMLTTVMLMVMLIWTTRNINNTALKNMKEREQDAIRILRLSEQVRKEASIMYDNAQDYYRNLEAIETTLISAILTVSEKHGIPAETATTLCIDILAEMGDDSAKEIQKDNE